MKISKKLLFLPLFALALVGCGGNDQKKEEEQHEHEEEATITLDKTSYKMDVDGTVTLVATLKNGKGSVTWTSSAPGVATVSETGVVTAIASGTATITASYSGKTATCVITVKGLTDYYALTAVLKNSNLKDFETNVADEDDNFRGQTSAVIEVGDDNAFNLKPTLTIINKETFETVNEDVWDFDYEYSIKEFVNDTYETTTTEYGEFDAEKCTFDFNENAIGKQFKLSVLPGGLTEEQKALPEYSTVVEVKVFDGYNVYTANELAYFNDVNIDKHCRQNDSIGEHFNENWVSFREANGLDAAYVAPSIFLQSNIKITKDNLPAEFFWASDEEAGVEGARGKMKDEVDVYIRYANGFTFNGNYFNVDTKEVPTCGNCASDDNISHSTLFKVAEFDTDGHMDFESNTILKNCSYFGNAPRGNDTTARLGLIFFKVHNNSSREVSKTVIHATFDNFNVSRSVISFYTEYCPSIITVKDCIISEGYSNGIFLYGNGDLNLINSKLTNFGGPIIVTSGTDNTVNGFHINASQDTILDNWVAGSEPWFVDTGAVAAIPLFQSADVFLNTAVNRTMLKGENKLMNIVLINYGKCAYVEFTRGDGVVGFDTTNPQATEKLTTLAEGKTIFMTENGGDVTLENNNPVAGYETIPNFVAADLFNILQLNSAFGFVSFICELVPVE